MDTFDRRTFLKAGGGALAALGLPALAAACGGSTSGSASTSSLQLVNDKPTWKTWFQQEGAQAKKATGAAWSPTEYSNEQVYEATIRTSGGAKAPDMFTWQADVLMQDLVTAGYMADLTSEWDKQGSVYSQGLRKLFTFNGKTYGAPLYFAPWVCFYNMHVFSKYNLTPPTNWSQMQQVMATLKSHGVAPLAATVDGVWSFVMFQTLMVANDPSLYQSVLDGKTKYTDPAVVAVMNQWGQMIKQGYFTDPSSVTFSTRGTNVTTPFSQGKVGMFEMGTWYEATLNSAGLKAGTDYGAFLFPMVKQGVPNALVIESGPLCAAEHSQHKADAVKAVSWFMSKAGQQEWVKLTGFISGRSDVPASSPVDQKVLSDMKAGSYQQLSRFYEGTKHQVVLTAISEFQKFLLHPGNPMPILNAIQNTANSAS